MYGSCIPEKPQTVTLPNISTSRQCWHCFGNSESEMLLFIFHGWKIVTAALLECHDQSKRKNEREEQEQGPPAGSPFGALLKTSPSDFCWLLFDQNGVTWPLYFQMRLENTGFQLGTWLSQREWGYIVRKQSRIDFGPAARNLGSSTWEKGRHSLLWKEQKSFCVLDME